MKLHTTTTQQYQTVTAYDETGVEINAIRYTHSLLVLPEVKPVAWPASSFDGLTEENFDQVNGTNPDVVILGTGKKQRFVHPKLIKALTAKQIETPILPTAADSSL